jgi:RNA polymerase sigma factor, sigma-70 family
MGVMQEDSSQIALCKQGDHASFELLIKKYQQMIHALCYRMTGSLEEAKDLSQDTFVQAYLNLTSYRADARFSSWLYRIAINQCLNWRTKQQRQTRLREEWSESLAHEAGSDQSHVVQEALLKLSAVQRAAIVLTIYEGLSHAEAGEVLHCSEATISWRVFAAKRKLKKYLRKP